MKLLSIIIPAYNASRYIETCLESIICNINILKENIELIIINDGSNDDTENRIQSIINKYPSYQIRYYFQLNQGASIARNNGINYANSEFLWFIDADDVIANCAIKELIEVIKNIDKSIDLIRIGNCSRGILFDDDSVLRNYSCFPNRQSFMIVDAFELLSPIYKNGHTMFLWRKDFIIKNKVFYPTNMIFNEDFHFLVNALLKANKAHINLSYNFYIIRENANSICRSPWTYKKQEKYIHDQITHIEMLLTLLNDFSIESFKKEVLRQYYEDYLSYMLFSRIRQKTQLSLTYYFLKKLDSMNVKLINANTINLQILNNKFTYFLAWVYYKVFKK